ncbi:50S ribosomal protein L34e [Candidatus Woesearchaeota archaeon]|nr:50S ribosomal protein L34e [Candidatus Woesearchaeota archaeon]
MVSGKHKSNSKRKVFVKAPGNTVKVHYRERKPNKAVCAVYGTPLAGVARETPSKMRNMPKTAKRPERPYGGVLSSRAMREKMKKKAREL